LKQKQNNWHGKKKKRKDMKRTLLLASLTFFHQAQPIQELGLKKAFPTKSKKGYGANIFAEFYDKISEIVFRSELPIRHYTFGWSGLLTLQTRRNAAKKLYEQLVKKIEKIKTDGYQSKIRLIGYSHGGNVALYLAEEERNHKDNLSIDELILISTPIQQDNQSHVAASLFKKVYNFYSKGDRVQTSDFLSSITHSFSHHTFLNKGTFKVPKKVTQIQICFLRKKITIPQKNGSVKHIHRRDYINPGHTEMFFFGWAAQWYRRHFPIKPLPVALLIPLIIKEIEKQHLAGKNIKIIIIPDDEIIIIKVKGEHRTVTVPFFSKKQCKIITKELLKFRPPDYKSRYKAKIKEVKIKAKQIFKEKLKKKSKKRILRKDQYTKKITKNHAKKIDAKSLKNHSSTIVGHVRPKPPA